MKNELPLKIVMIDMEFTGVIPTRDDVLQVAMVKCDLDVGSMSYKVVGKPLNIFLKTEVKPHRPFHHEHLLPCFEKCSSEGLTQEEAYKAIDAFLGKTEKRWPSGDCVATDLGFLFNKKLIDYNDYDENDTEIPGHLDYRVLEMKPLKVVAKTLGWEAPADQLREHDGLNDCFNQLYELNDCLSFLFSHDKSNYDGE